MQRLRKNSAIRTLVRETHLRPQDFILPLFIEEGLANPVEILHLPGVYRHSLESLFREIESCLNSGITAAMLFGVPKTKDEEGRSAFQADGIVQKSISEIKKRFPDLIVIADCCLCGYTSHGHCGVISNGMIDTDATLSVLAEVARSYAERGVDCVAPSGMIDGMVKTIRSALDEDGFPMISIMSYTGKFASHLYGPFRHAAGFSEHFKGDRSSHQLDPSQKREAIREALMDIEEGADFLMVKPATPYLDILSELRKKTYHPIAAYQVSGEYSMVKIAAQHGILDEKKVFHELFTGIKRAGADMIISYYAKEIANHLKTCSM